jgi:hypothetical protein
MITPTANTEMMNLHLAEISTQVAKDAIAVVACDGAGWHQQGGGLVVPDNIVLLHLPPYSPELNPMENVWDYLRWLIADAGVAVSGRRLCPALARSAWTQPASAALCFVLSTVR